MVIPQPEKWFCPDGAATTYRVLHHDLLISTGNNLKLYWWRTWLNLSVDLKIATLELQVVNYNVTHPFEDGWGCFGAQCGGVPWQYILVYQHNSDRKKTGVLFTRWFHVLLQVEDEERRGALPVSDIYHWHAVSASQRLMVKYLFKHKRIESAC